MEVIVSRDHFLCTSSLFVNTDDVASKITGNIGNKVSVTGTNIGAGVVASIDAGDCLIAGIGTGDCLVTEVVASIIIGTCLIAGVFADDVAGTVEVADSVACVIANTYTIAGIVASVVVGVCLAAFKISGACCSIDMLVVVIVSFSVGGMCSENYTLGRGVFILIRDGISELGGKERLERSSLFNYSSKSF
jgi:hypothetical protein